MKTLFKIFMALHVGLYKLSGGRLGGNMRGFQVLLLNTVGRKSGKAFTIPLGWFAHPEGYVIVASNAGQDHHPAWYHNLKSNPGASIQVGERVIAVTAEVLAGEARSQVWRAITSTASAYAGYEKATTREIPLVLLRPVK